MELSVVSREDPVEICGHVGPAVVARRHTNTDAPWADKADPIGKYLIASGAYHLV